MKESAVPANATGPAVAYTGDDGENHAPPGRIAAQKKKKRDRMFDIAKKLRRKLGSAN